MSQKFRATDNAPIDGPNKRRNQRSENIEIEPTAVDEVYQEPDALGTGKRKRIPSE